MKIYKGARIQWAGKRSYGRTTVPRGIRTGMAVQKQVIRLTDTEVTTFTGVTEKMYGFQPLSDFIASTQFTNFIKPAYEEFRIVKASYRFIPMGSNGGGIFMTANGMLHCVSWDRSSTYGVLGAPTLQIMMEDPDTKFAIQNQSQTKILYSSLVADKGHLDWLSTDANPGAAPNTGMFFCPAIYLGLGLQAASTDTYTFKIILELLIEARGFKNPH